MARPHNTKHNRGRSNYPKRLAKRGYNGNSRPHMTRYTAVNGELQRV